jgi:hypothetical protein
MAVAMTADDNGSFDLKAFLSTGPIRWLIGGGAFLIAAIAIGTIVMVDNFRERALNSNRRELENTVNLLARHFDQQLEDFTIILRDIANRIRVDGTTSQTFRAQLATRAWHDELSAEVSAYSDVAAINVFDANGMLINSSDAWPVPDVNIADRGYFNTLKSSPGASMQVELVRGRRGMGDHLRL